MNEAHGKADVLIIGGGVIGCLTAIELHALGLSAVVLERGEPGRESSWAGAGILCPIQPWLYPDAFTRLSMASLELWPILAHDLEAATGISVQWLRSGMLVPFFADDDIAEWDAALAWSARFAWRVDALDDAAARRIEPLLAPSVERALHWPDVGQARNPRLLRAVRERMRQLGIGLREGCAVAGLIKDGGSGAVRGVRLSDGTAIHGRHVLLAAGSWSGEIAQRFGLSLPVEPVKGQIVLIRTQPGAVRHIVKHPSAYFVPRVDGRVLIGASMERVGFRRGTSSEEIERLLAAMRRIAPALSDAPIERAWMGFRPGTPDGLPCLGPVEGRPGLWIASGHYRNGVLLAPVTARWMARWIAGEAPPMDMEPFAPQRRFVPDARIGLPEPAG
ncbi:MAG: glycine oxidase ThiO [Mariprofundaceae bacterium]